MAVAEIETPYRERSLDSESKLNTFRDGIRILKTIVLFAKDERPLQFFSVFFALLSVGAVVLAWPLLTTYLETGLVPRFPTAILATGLMVVAFLCLTCGVILETVTLGRQEAKRMRYLAIPRQPADVARYEQPDMVRSSASGEFR